MPEFPYDHDYTFCLSIGFAGSAQRWGAANPAKDSSYSEDKWDALPEEEKRQWLADALAEWADGYIETSWSVEER